MGDGAKPRYDVLSLKTQSIRLSPDCLIMHDRCAAEIKVGVAATATAKLLGTAQSINHGKGDACVAERELEVSLSFAQSGTPAPRRHGSANLARCTEIYGVRLALLAGASEGLATPSADAEPAVRLAGCEWPAAPTTNTSKRPRRALPTTSASSAPEAVTRNVQNLPNRD